MSYLEFSLLLGSCLKKYPYKIVSQKEWWISPVLTPTSLKYYDVLLSNIIKGRVRVVNESMKTGNVFYLTTKDSQITEKMSWLEFSLLLGTCLGENPYDIVSHNINMSKIS